VLFCCTVVYLASLFLAFSGYKFNKPESESMNLNLLAPLFITIIINSFIIEVVTRNFHIMVHCYLYYKHIFNSVIYCKQVKVV